MKSRGIRPSAALSLLLAVLLLSGCAGQERPYAVADVQSLLDAGVFRGQMEELDGAVLIQLYGLDPEDVVDCAGYLALDSASSADEVAVLVLTDETAAQTALEACQKRVADQLKTCRTYAPAAVPSLEAAVVDRVDNTVLLAVGDPQLLPDAVTDLRA